jgi:hypothetical protein
VPLTKTNYGRLTAVEWLRQSSAVAERARRRISGDGQAVPDTLLDDPTRLVALFEEALVQAIREDAPPGVAEELLLQLRLVSTASKRFDRDGFAAHRLSTLRGLRDPSELQPALEAGIAAAPDSASRAQLTRWLDLVNAAPAADSGADLMTIPLFPDEGTVPTGIGEPTPGRPVLPDPGITDTGRSGTDLGGRPTGEPVIDPVNLTRSVVDIGADIGRQVASDVAQQLEVPFDVQRAAELGAAIAGGGGFGGDGSGSGFFEALGKVVGAAVGELVGGPAGAVMGAAFGGGLGKAVDHAFSGSGSVDEEDLVDIVEAAACVLCGPTCIICMLTVDALLH